MANWFTTETTQGIRTLDDRTAGLEPLQKSIRTLQTVEEVSVLDVGCAEGLIGDWLTLGKSSRLVGLEGDEIKVASAHEIYADQIADGRYEFIRGNADHLDECGISGSFDVVLLLAILQKLNDPMSCLEKAVRLANKFFALRVPEYFWTEHKDDIYKILTGWQMMYEVRPTENDEEHRGRLVVWQKPGLEEKLNIIRANLRNSSKADHLARCDYPIVSFPKSGRTWIRYFLGQYLNIKHNMPMDLEFMPQPYWTEERQQLDFPNIHFTHDWFDLNFNNNERPCVYFKELFDKKPIIFLFRNPMDTMVSYYYHKVKRERTENNLDLSIREFMLDDRYGLGRYCIWMDQMLDYLIMRPNVLFITYEHMIENMSREMTRMFDFMKIRKDIVSINRASSDSEFNSMQKAEIEANQHPSAAGIGRLSMREWDGDPDKLKVRKGKVGSWQDELELDDTFIRKMIYDDSNIKIYFRRLKMIQPKMMHELAHLID